MSHACTAESRAQAAAATGAGNGPCGSGVGTASLSLSIPAHALRATARAGSMSPVTLPSRVAGGLEGVLARDVSADDVVLVLETLSAIALPGDEGGRALRHRYLALFLQALRAPGAGPLPGHAAEPGELAVRWRGGK